MSTVEPVLGLVLPDPGIPGVAGSGDQFDGTVLNTNWSKVARRAGVTAYKITEVDHNNTTAVSDDNDLILALPIVGRWVVHGVVYFRSTAASGFKVDLQGDGTGLTNSEIRWSYTGFATTGLLFGNSAQSITVADTGFKALHFNLGCLTSTTVALLKLRWAQVTSGAGPTTVLAGSFFHGIFHG